MRRVFAVALALVVLSALGCERPQLACDSNLNITVDMSMGSLPDTCVSRTAAAQIMNWRSSDGSKLEVKIPDWDGTNPTTKINPYPNPQCLAGTACTSGQFKGGAIPNETSIQYSLTLTSNPASKRILGHIIIKP